MEAEVLVETAIEELDQIVGSDKEPVVNTTVEPVVIRAEIGGDEIRLHCPTPEIAAKVEAGRSRFVQVLAEIGGSLDQDQDDQEQGVVPIPCAFCGSLLPWWDLKGGIHCSDCDPPLRAEMLQLQARRLRQAAPTPTGVAVGPPADF